MYELTKEYLRVVKLTGPGLGQKASGSLAGQLTFSNWKDKGYLKVHRKPKQPRSPAQVSLRATMAFLSQQWSTIVAADQATWLNLARASEISPFNAYQAYNIKRARNNQRSTKAYPALELPLYAVSAGWYATGGVRQIEIGLTITDRRDAWASTQCHVPGTGIVPDWNQFIKFLAMPATGPVSWIWKPLPAGTYWIGFGQATVTGKQYDTDLWRSAVVTN